MSQIKTSPGTMQNLLIKVFGEKHRQYVVLALNWRRIVGDYFAKQSTVVKVDKKVLFIGADNSVIIQEFVLIKENLKSKINSMLPVEIEDIVFFTTARFNQKRSKRYVRRKKDILSYSHKDMN